MNLMQQFKAEAAAAVAAGKCVHCGQQFSDKNVHSDAGWREVKISGMCEDCFDAVTAEPEEEGEDDAPPF